MIGRLRRWCKAWALWEAPRRVIIYVLIVDAIAVTATISAVAMTTISPSDLGRFATLAVCAWVAIELTRHIERMREHARRTSVAYIDTKAVWSFAAVIILPVALACAIVVLSYFLSWTRVRFRSRTRIVHRWLFSAATVLCATHVAAFVLDSGMSAYPGVPESTSLVGLADVGIIVVAGLLRWACNAGLVMAAFAISDPALAVRDLFANRSEYLLEAGAAGLGLVTAVIVVSNPFVLPGVLISMVALHRSVLVSHYQQESRIDAKTGLASVGRWHEFAEQSLARARDRGTSLGLLILDLDHFKSVNDTYGHPFGDKVLKAVADELRAEIRDDDACGRWGGEEFAIVLPDVGTEHDLYRIAERVRRRVESIVIETPRGPGAVDMISITASVGGTICPAGSSMALDDLLLAADSALYEAKNNGRNAVRLAPEVSSVGQVESNLVPPPKRTSRPEASAN